MANYPSPQAVVRSHHDLPHIIDALVSISPNMPIRVHVPNDVSANMYCSIARYLRRQNHRRSRRDFIENPRRPPYKPMMEILNVHELECAVEEMGAAFLCIPIAPRRDVNQAIATRAQELGVEVDNLN